MTRLESGEMLRRRAAYLSHTVNGAGAESHLADPTQRLRAPLGPRELRDTQSRNGPSVRTETKRPDNLAVALPRTVMAQ